MPRQFFELRPGQTLLIDGARVTLEAKSGQKARLRVESESQTRIESTPPTPPRPVPAATPPAIPRLQRPVLPGR